MKLSNLLTCIRFRGKKHRTELEAVDAENNKISFKLEKCIGCGITSRVYTDKTGQLAFKCFEENDFHFKSEAERIAGLQNIEGLVPVVVPEFEEDDPCIKFVVMQRCYSNLFSLKQKLMHLMPFEEYRSFVLHSVLHIHDLMNRIAEQGCGIGDCKLENILVFFFLRHAQQTQAEIYVWRLRGHGVFKKKTNGHGKLRRP